MKTPNIETYYTLTCEEVEELILNAWGKAVDIAAEQEWSEAYYRVSAYKKNYTADEKHSVDCWLKYGNWPYIYAVVIALVDIDAIPEGEYLIKVDW